MSSCPPSENTYATRPRQRRPARRDDRQAAAEADAHQRDLVIRRERGVRRDPAAGVLDRVGDRRRDLEPRQLGNVGRDDRDAAGAEVAGEPHEPRLVDARRVEPRGQQRRPPVRSGRLVQPRAHRPAPCRDRDLALADRHGVEVGGAARRALHLRGAHDERQAVDVRPHDERGAGERRDDDEEREDAPGAHDAHGILKSDP